MACEVPLTPTLSPQAGRIFAFSLACGERTRVRGIFYQ